MITVVCSPLSCFCVKLYDGVFYSTSRSAQRRHLRIRIQARQHGCSLAGDYGKSSCCCGKPEITTNDTSVGIEVRLLCTRKCHGGCDWTLRINNGHLIMLPNYFK